MKASIMCGLAKLKRRRIPNLLLGICIMITVVLLVNASVFLKESDRIFDRAYEEMNGPQMCCLWSRDTVSCDRVRQYLDRSSEKFDYQITENTKTVDYIEKDGVKLSNGIILELSDAVYTSGGQAEDDRSAVVRDDRGGNSEDLLSPKVLGETGAGIQKPGRGEVWITVKTANILDLEVGDTFFLQFADEAVEVRAAKIVADPVFGGSSTNVYRMWCAHGRLSDFPTAKNHAVSYLDIRFRQYSSRAEQNFIRETEEYFQMPLGDTLYTYEQIKSGYTNIYRMAGAVLCLVSVILSVTVAALVIFLLESDMNEDVRNIGIYKSLGMTGGEIAGVYLVCYGIIGAPGAALGSVLGGWLNRGIVTKILGDMGIYTVSFAGIRKYPALVWLVVTAMIMAVCFCSVIKVWRVNASVAVRRGRWNPDEKGRREKRVISYDGRRSFELFYAIRGIQNKKIRYLYIAGMSLVFGCLAAVCLGCLNSVRNIDKDPESWGFIKTDIYVTALKDMPVSSIIDELEHAPEVDYTYGVNKVYTKYLPDGEKGWKSLVTELYGLPWNKKIKDRSLYGRRPEKDDEISVGISLAEEYGLDIGGTMELFVNGTRREYKITGIFQTLSNQGKVIRMVTDDLDQFMEPDGGFGDYMLVLSEEEDKWEYAERLNEKYKGVFTFTASKSNGENITGILTPIMGTVLAVLLTVLVMVTMNLTFLLVRREQALIGLLRAAGMTSWQILKIYLLRNCLSAFSGSIMGVAAGTFIVPGLLDPPAKGMGLTEFPFSGSLQGAAIGSLLLPLCMFLGTCVIIRTISRISVKELVSE